MPCGLETEQPTSHVGASFDEDLVISTAAPNITAL